MLSRQNTVVDTVNDASEDDKDTNVENRKTKKCKYFNIGFCKHKSKCRFMHPEQICEEYLEKYKCERKEFSLRHLKNTGAANMEYKCSGCKSSWTEKCHAKEHVIQNMQTFFCLNCEDYMKDKPQIVNEGLTLVDEHWFLRRYL